MYISKRKPRVHQKEALDLIRGRKAFALLLGFRTGKTKILIDDWGEMGSRGECVDLLVIAPGGAYLPWRDALTDDLPDELLSRMSVFVWNSSDPRPSDRKRFLEHEGPRALIMNIEAVSAVRAARDFCLDFLSTERTSEIAIDESVTIGNPTSKCSEFIVEKLAPLAEYRRILSGLITPRSPLQVYPQFRFLDPSILGFSKYTEFRDRYAVIKRICTLPNIVVKAKFENVMGFRKLSHMTDSDLILRMRALGFDVMPRPHMMGFLGMAAEQTKREDMIEAIFRMGSYIQSAPVIEGYRDLDDIESRIAPFTFKRRLEDCYDMPSSDYSFRYIEMTPEQLKMYEDLKQFAVAKIEGDSYVSAPMVVVQMLRLHQVLCGHTVDEEGNEHLIPENRTKALIDLLEDYEGKAVVWCSYNTDIAKVSAALAKRFGQASVARFWGGNRKTRENEEAAFKTDPLVRWMVATPDAGGRGRAWDVANLAVYYSCRDNLDHRVQSEDRLKAFNKTTLCAYVDFCVPGSVEEKILDALRRKIDLVSVINGGNWRNWLI